MLRKIAGGVLFSTLVACEAVIGASYGDKTGECDPLLTAEKCPKDLGCYWDTTIKKFQCSTSKNTSGLWGACNVEADCPSGFGCIIPVGATQSYCLPYCHDNSTCFGKSSCVGFKISRTLHDGSEVGVCGALDPACDPFASSTECASVGNGFRCFLYGPELTTCFPSLDTKQPGEACSSVADCAEGSSCSANDSVCKKLCHVGGSDCSTSCHPIEGLTSGSESVGLCDP